MDHQLKIFSFGRKFFVILLLLSLSESLFAGALDRLRDEAMDLSRSADKLVESTTVRSLAQAKTNPYLKRLLVLKDKVSQLSAGSNVYKTNALTSLTYAIEVSSWDQSAYTAGHGTPAQILIEMYLVHVDTDLMLLEYQVGKDLRRVRD